jgi:hypothetical protein
VSREKTEGMVYIVSAYRVLFEVLPVTTEGNLRRVRVSDGCYGPTRHRHLELGCGFLDEINVVDNKKRYNSLVCRPEIARLWTAAYA